MNITQKTKKNGQTVYQASLYLGVDSVTGKKVRTTITAKTKKGVQLKANQKKAEFEQKGGTVYQEVKITYFHELLDLWFDTYRLGKKENTIRVFNNIKKNYLLPPFGHLPVEKITTINIQKVVNEWARKAHQKKTSDEKVAGVYKDYKLLFSFVKNILKYAVSMNLLETNPADKVAVPPLPKLESTRKKFFTEEEVKKLLHYLDNNCESYSDLFHTTLYKLLLATGLRINEALALEWSDIDFKNKTISVTKTLDSKKQINSPKTRSSIRIIDVDTSTIDTLKYYHKRQRLEAMKLGKSEKIVFSRFMSKYTHRQDIHKKFEATLEKAGIPRTSFHAFRHTHASILLNAGVPYKQLQLRLGHSKLEMTMDIYAHLSKENLKETANIFETSLKNIKTG